VYLQGTKPDTIPLSGAVFSILPCRIKTVQPLINTQDKMIYFSHPDLRIIKTSIDKLNRSDLKILVSLARLRDFPLNESYPHWNRYGEFVLQHLIESYGNQSDPIFTNFGYALNKLIHHGTLSSMVISMCFAAPIDQDTVDTIRFNSALKEFCATQTRPGEYSMNWSIFFNTPPKDKDILHDGCILNPPLNNSIRRQFRNWKQRITGSTLYPHYTNKNVSNETTTAFLESNYYQETGTGLFKSSVTSLELTRRYILTGVETHGPVTMKQKWYPSGLVPRTYFAQGGTAFFSSMYLQKIFNSLVDTLPITNRFNRVSGSRLRLTGRSSFFIYDFTSFTSLFHEIRPFLSAMAEWLLGVEVILIGPELRASPSDLGSLIYGYLDNANLIPEFDIMETMIPMVEVGLYIHECAGFLGVYGNIALCTLAHGLAVTQHLTHFDQSSVAGDDGAIAEDEDNYHDHAHLNLTLSKLGTYLLDKCSRVPPASVYLKRLMFIENDRGIISNHVDHTLLTEIYQDKRPIHLTPTEESFATRRYRMASSISRSIELCYQFSNGDLSSYELDILMSWFRYLYEILEYPEMGVSYHRSRGYDYGDSSHYLDTLVYPLSANIFLNDPKQWALDVSLEGWGDFPIEEDIDTDLPDELYPGMELRVNRKEVWTFLSDMGYLKAGETEKETLIGEELKSRLSRKPRASKHVYLIHVLRPVSNLQLRSLQLITDFPGEPLPERKRRLLYYDLDEPTESKRAKFETYR